MSTPPQTSATFRPEIVESYRDFEPPPNFKQNIETLLIYVPQKYLVGLTTVVLTNREGLTRDKRWLAQLLQYGTVSTQCALAISYDVWNGAAT